MTLKGLVPAVFLVTLILLASAASVVALGVNNSITLSRIANHRIYITGVIKGYKTIDLQGSNALVVVNAILDHASLVISNGNKVVLYGHIYAIHSSINIKNINYLQGTLSLNLIGSTIDASYINQATIRINAFVYNITSWQVVTFEHMNYLEVPTARALVSGYDVAGIGRILCFQHIYKLDIGTISVIGNVRSIKGSGWTTYNPVDIEYVNNTYVNLVQIYSILYAENVKGNAYVSSEQFDVKGNGTQTITIRMYRLLNNIVYTKGGWLYSPVIHSDTMGTVTIENIIVRNVFVHTNRTISVTCFDVYMTKKFTVMKAIIGYFGGIRTTPSYDIYDMFFIYKSNIYVGHILTQHFGYIAENVRPRITCNIIWSGNNFTINNLVNPSNLVNTNLTSGYKYMKGEIMLTVRGGAWISAGGVGVKYLRPGTTVRIELNYNGAPITRPEDFLLMTSNVVEMLLHVDATIWINGHKYVSNGYIEFYAANSPINGYVEIIDGNGHTHIFKPTAGQIVGMYNGHNKPPVVPTP